MTSSKRVTDVSQLLEILRNGDVEKNVQLDGTEPFKIPSEGILPAGDNTIRCQQHIIDAANVTETFPQGYIAFQGCTVLLPDAGVHLAQELRFDASTVFSDCKMGTGNRTRGQADWVTQNDTTFVTHWRDTVEACRNQMQAAAAPSPPPESSSGAPLSMVLLVTCLGGVVVLLLVALLVVVLLRRRWRRKRPQRQGSKRQSAWQHFGSTPAHNAKSLPKGSRKTSSCNGSQEANEPAGSTKSSIYNKAIPSQISLLDSMRGAASGCSPSPQPTSEAPGTPGTPPGTSVSSVNSDLPAAMQSIVAQLKRDLPDVPLDIIQHIGTGGYGNVYRGIWKGLEVAIKTIVFQDHLQESTAQSVIKEAAIACNMSHEHIVNTFTHELKRMPVQVPGEVMDYKLYIIQEFCVGGSLAKLLSGEHLMTRSGGVHVHRVLTVLRHVAGGMAYMHKLRMVHGDLNPSNIFLQLLDSKYVQTPQRRKRAWKPLTKEAARGLDDGNTVVKLGDFGLTVKLQNGRSHVSNVMHGTPFYSAPELATHGRLQCESDVYSFGVLMWEMYHNDTPYDLSGDNYIPNPCFGQFSADAPLNYALLAISCLSAAPSDRPSFAQILDFLTAIGMELASGYYTNMHGSTLPASYIMQKPQQNPPPAPPPQPTSKSGRQTSAEGPLGSPWAPPPVPGSHANTSARVAKHMAPLLYPDAAPDMPAMPAALHHPGHTAIMPAYEASLSRSGLGSWDPSRGSVPSSQEQPYAVVSRVASSGPHSLGRSAWHVDRNLWPDQDVIVNRHSSGYMPVHGRR